MSSVQYFTVGMNSNHSATRQKACEVLYHYINTELRQLSDTEQNIFIAELLQHIFNMVSSLDSHQQIGGLLSILCLIGTDVANINNHTSRFANCIRYLFPSANSEVTELAVKTMGKLALNFGTFADEYVEYEVKRAFEWLTDLQIESKRYTAVLILKEMATVVPILFFQHAAQFLNLILNVVCDSKPCVRIGAAEALRAACVLTAQRETFTQSQWFEQCYREVMDGLDDSTNMEIGDDSHFKIHGSLLVLNELLAVSNTKWENLNGLFMRKFQWEQNKNDVVIPCLLLHTYSPLKSLVRSSGRTVDEYVRFTPSDNIQYESEDSHNLIRENYDQVFTLVLSHGLSRETLLISAIVKVLPRLAAFNKSIFVQNNLDSAMVFLVQTAQSHDCSQRTDAFVAIGLVAIIVRDQIVPYLANIFDTIRTVLKSEDDLESLQRDEPGIYICITLLAIATQQNIQNVLNEQFVDLLFAMKICPVLMVSLKELAETVPSLPLKNYIRGGLSRILSGVLCIQTPELAELSINDSTTDPSPSSTLVDEPRNPSNVILALKTIGTFDCSDNIILQLLNDFKKYYLCCKSQDVRAETVRTYCRLLIIIMNKSHVKNVIPNHIDQILIAGVSDTDPNVRYAALKGLDHNFDSHLGLAKNMSVLNMAMYDASFEVREMAIIIKGRLFQNDPVSISPLLNIKLLQCITEFIHSGISSKRVESIGTIGIMAVHIPEIISAHMQIIINMLDPILEKPDLNPSILTSVLVCIGHLVQVGGKKMHSWASKLISVLLAVLRDGGGSREKREVALWVLSKLAEENLILPYGEYSSLLDVLLGFLSTEPRHLVRREILRVLGLLGTLDPCKHKINMKYAEFQIKSSALVPLPDSCSILETEWKINEVLFKSDTLDEYYPPVAISTLIRIIRDPNLIEHHHIVVQALTLIFQSLGVECALYIRQVMPSVFCVIRSAANASIREYCIRELGVLVNVIGQNIRYYLNDIYSLIKEYWTPNCLFKRGLIRLVECLVAVCGGSFAPYLFKLMPNILKVLDADRNEDHYVTESMVLALGRFGVHLDGCEHMVIPPLVQLFDATQNPIQISRAALDTVARFSFIVDLTAFASHIIHRIVNVIETSPNLRDNAMETLCALICQIKHDYLIFTPLINRTFAQHNYTYLLYDTLITYISSDKDEIPEENILQKIQERYGNKKKKEIRELRNFSTVARKPHMSLINLQKSWSVNRCLSKDDWVEWFKRLGVALLRESPSPPLRSCWTLAQKYSQLPKDLFNVSFVSCWVELSPPLRDELIQCLNQALMVTGLPEMTRAILNLADFMDRCKEGPLPIATCLLIDGAMNCSAYTNVLRYIENEFTEEVCSGSLRLCTIESLISANIKLHQNDVASALLNMIADYQYDVAEPDEIDFGKTRWTEKLSEWDVALSDFQELSQNERDVNNERCLESLSLWDIPNAPSTDCMRLHVNQYELISIIATVKAWKLKNWQQVDIYVKKTLLNTFNGAYFRAILSIYLEKYEDGQKFIDLAREIVDTKLTSVTVESCQRAGSTMVSVQMLTELEEVIQYRLYPEKQQTIYKIWQDRLKGYQKNIEHWQHIIQLQSMVLTPEENINTLLMYASLCRKSARMILCRNTLTELLGSDPSNDPTTSLPMVHPQVTFEYIKYMWTFENKSTAYSNLINLVEYIKQQMESNTEFVNNSIKTLLTKCYLKLGIWQENLEGLTENSIPSILKYFEESKCLSPNCYTAWHSWALINCKMVLHHKHQQNNTDINQDRNTELIHKYAVVAIRGFFKSISCCHGDPLQDMLGLSNLWFNYGHIYVVYMAISEELKSSPIDPWLKVIPQLMAHIDSHHVLISTLVHQLLMDIGEHHPHALIYPLTVASNTTNKTRSSSAVSILNAIGKINPDLVQQAAMVSKELVRVSKSWEEIWCKAIDEALIKRENMNELLEILGPIATTLHNAKTPNEKMFFEEYSEVLFKALLACKRYVNLKDDSTKDKVVDALNALYRVRQLIAKKLSQYTNLELKSASPKLYEARDMVLAVPGSYVPGQPVVTIVQFCNVMSVMASKQRPRKLRIKGSDGKLYAFLLKGNEDLRQDERVMQLFDLINTLLSNDPDTLEKNLTIQRFAVIPVSRNTGLIGWLPHCDTLHSLITDYRQKRSIPQHFERINMSKYTKDYNSLVLMQKVEVFEHGLSQSRGDDLAKVLWYKSPSSQVWFDRRTNYTKSLAVMSMVGYVLGLGDRHPSNMMLDRSSGNIVHIDYGDCFEVTMKRKKFPEKVPFRLTRMLIKAMDATGIEGTYRSTCISTMTVLRNNKDDLMSVLEAFVYDPSPGSGDTEFETNNPVSASIVSRILEKLTGNDFENEHELDVSTQVDYLIQQATSNVNLCQSFSGWYSYW